MNDKMFDYIGVSQSLEIPEDVLRRLEDEARREFPFDAMMTEPHVRRAVKVYAANMRKAAGN
jgi:hypothetical protein